MTHNFQIGDEVCFLNKRDFISVLRHGEDPYSYKDITAEAFVKKIQSGKVVSLNQDKTVSVKFEGKDKNKTSKPENFVLASECASIAAQYEKEWIDICQQIRDKAKLAGEAIRDIAKLTKSLDLGDGMRAYTEEFSEVISAMEAVGWDTSSLMC